jgi:hypothetical protein
MRHLLKISLVLFLGGITVLQAQEGSGLDTEDITVVKDYEARIADAQKINVNPKVADVELPAPELSYNVPSRLLELKYPPHSMKPYSMPKVKATDYNHSYIKLGFGTQYSPLAEMVYINKDIDDLEFGASFKHLSSYGQKVENQKFRDNQLGVFAKYNLEKVLIGTNFKFQQDVDYFYGYNQEDTTFSADDVKHRVREICGDISIQNGAIGKKNFDHKQVITTSFANDNFKVNEWFLNYRADFTKVNKNTHFFNIHADIDVSNFTPSAPNRGDLEREVFQFGSDYTFNNDDWKLTAGVTAAIGDINDAQQFNIYPKLYTEKMLYKNYLIFYSGWSRRLQKNTYLNFAQENPFINYDIMLENSRIEDRMAGFKGAIGQFTYSTRFSNKVVKQMPLFVNDSTDMKRFDVVYDKSMTIINVNLEAAYDWNKKFRSLLSFDFNLYEPDGQEKAWHLPMINTNFSTSYLLKEKLLMRAELYGVAGAFGRNMNGDAQKIKGMVDINLGANYQFTKYLSFFAQMNNLANFKYQKWYNYPTFGFNAMVGVQFRY